VHGLPFNGIKLVPPVNSARNFPAASHRSVSRAEAFLKRVASASAEVN